jgi:hypothetical protein
MDEINGQAVIEKKVCNALIQGAKPNFNLYLISPESFGGPFNQMMDGLWVGGNIYLTDKSIIFKPNKLNAAMHTNIYTVKIPLEDITNVSKESRMFTDIVIINTAYGTLKFRCYKASDFMERINSQILKPISVDYKC